MRDTGHTCVRGLVLLRPRSPARARTCHPRRTRSIVLYSKGRQEPNRAWHACCSRSRLAVHKTLPRGRHLRCKIQPLFMSMEPAWYACYSPRSGNRLHENTRATRCAGIYVQSVISTSGFSHTTPRLLCGTCRNACFNAVPLQYSTHSTNSVLLSVQYVYAHSTRYS